jgi:hypothetical protein
MVSPSRPTVVLVNADLDLGGHRLFGSRLSGEKDGNRRVVLIVVSGGPAGPGVVAHELPILVKDTYAGYDGVRA